MKTLYTSYAVTVADFTSGPPASPSTGDIWIASNVDANGTRWSFQYNAGSSSAYKWEFIGGAPLQAGPSGSMTLSATGDTALTGGPSLVIARAGDYIINFGMEISAGSAQFLDYEVHGSVAGWFISRLINSPDGFFVHGQAGQRANALAAQTLTVGAAIANATVTTTLANGEIEVIPVRVG